MRKKFDIRGAIAFNSPTIKHKKQTTLHRVNTRNKRHYTGCWQMQQTYLAVVKAGLFPTACPSYPEPEVAAQRDRAPNWMSGPPVPPPPIEGDIFPVGADLWKIVGSPMLRGCHLNCPPPLAIHWSLHCPKLDWSMDCLPWAIMDIASDYDFSLRSYH